MNQVKTYIDRSSIEGIGLFAAEYIPKGTLVWKFSGLDQMLSEDKLLSMRLTEIEMYYFRRYEFGKDNLYIFCADDAKYCNHSDNPNTEGYPNQYAIKDIQIGEEITCHYGNINQEWDRKEFEQLKSWK